jgi:hypothetical protein
MTKVSESHETANGTKPVLAVRCNLSKVEAMTAVEFLRALT